MSAQPTLRVTVVDAFATAREQFEELPEFLRTEEALGMTHSDMD